MGKGKKSKKREGSLPAFLSDAEARRNVNRRSAKQEAAWAGLTGGKVQPGSGSSKRAPEDVVGPIDDDGEGILWQLKEYVTGKITITEDQCVALRDNSWRAGRDPGMIVDFPKTGIRLMIAIEEIP